MTDPSESLNEALVALVQQGLLLADKERLIEVAKALWYSPEVPDPSNLPPQCQNDVCYVIDRLARFNVLSKSRKLQLLNAIEKFRKDLGTQPASATLDPLAASWGASGDLIPFMQDLLPFQTRHFAASQTGGGAD